jgi:hypothetical protein
MTRCSFGSKPEKNTDPLFVYVAVMLPSRAVYYYSDRIKEKWTGKLTDATFFKDKSSADPLFALPNLQGDFEHKWVELQP